MLKDELKLPLNTLKVVEIRYLKKDDQRNIIETPLELFRRVAKAIAQAENNFKDKKITRLQAQERFFNMMRNLNLCLIPLH